MAKKRFSPEQVVGKLRSYCESFNGTLRDELLNGEIFYSLNEARIVIERWRREYNEIRPHSSLGYRPPAPLSPSIRGGAQWGLCRPASRYW